MKVILITAVAGLVLSSCMQMGGGASSSSSGSATSGSANLASNSGNGSNSGGSGSGSSSSSSVAQVAISSIMEQSMNLGVSLSVPVVINSTNGYSGPVNLSIDKSVLAANDPNNTFSVSIEPATVNVLSGGSAQATVTVLSQSASPDLSSYIHVIASTPGGPQVTQTLPLQVNAVYEIDIMSAGSVSTTGIENWSLPALSTVSFATHKNGVTINFVNKDLNEASGFYRIHSTATAFLHQGGQGLGLPGAATPNTDDGSGTGMIATTVGNTYSVTVTSQTAQLTDMYYDHNNENASKAGRKLVFNAYAAAAVIGKSGNPNASFAYLEKNLFDTSMCMSCHVTNPAAGNNVNLGTYAGVLTQVQAGSALGSPLYVQIAAGGSMPQGNPGSVSASLVQDVEDWINDGAANN